jgi:hypothetical protein
MSSSNLNRVLIVGITILLNSCTTKDCKEITQKDIAGFYVSMYSLNENLQYLEIREDGSYFNRYCLNGEFIEETSKWEYSKICTVTLRNIFWLNSPSKDIQRGDPVFGFNYGRILSMGDDVWSFKRVRFRPKLECE